MEQRRTEAIHQLEQRRRTVTGKLDRGYDDFVSGAISDELWRRKSAEWEADLRAVEGELARMEQPSQPVMATAERILELAQKANFFTNRGIGPNSGDCWKSCYRTARSIAEGLTPTYNSPFDLLVRGNKSGNWRRGWDSNPRAPYGTRRFRGAPVTTTSVPLRRGISGAELPILPDQPFSLRHARRRRLCSVSRAPRRWSQALRLSRPCD
jgi:hypothetical protein